MATPPKFPRPPKPPIRPRDPDLEAVPTVSLQFERLIGRVIIAWSKLEASMEDLIWSLLDLEIENGRVMTARVDAVGKIRMLRELGRQEMPEQMFHRLSPTLDEIDVLREDRNFMAHGTWGRQRIEMTMIHVCMSLKFKPLAQDEVIAESVPEGRIRTLIDGIERTKWTLIGLQDEYHALPGKSVPPRHADS
jgi:hypothetical protein